MSPAPRGGKFSTYRVRPAFTLVELLVVIVILAMLASLVTVAASRAMTAARNAAIKAEIDMLHIAIMNYKNEYGSFPPCFDANPSAQLTNNQITSVAQKHLQRLFPRCTTVSGPAGQFAGSVALTPATALIAWLSGYNSDPTQPLQPIVDKSKLFDFDTSRVGHIDANSPTTTRLVYLPSQKPESPYIYIHNSVYGNSWPPADYEYYAGSTKYTIPANTYAAVPDPKQPGKYLNSETFQILNAGKDGLWGGTGADDDISNFWPRTRKDYLDSLTQ